MKKFFKILQLLGAIMFALGCVLPFILGTRITAVQYTNQYISAYT